MEGRRAVRRRERKSKDGKRREYETWGEQGGNKQPCESTSSAYKGRAFTKVSPEASSCHGAKKRN